MGGEGMAREELVWLNPKGVRFFYHDGVLRMTLGERESFWRVQIYPCFPLTDPDRYLSVRDVHGEEIGLLRDLNELDPESQRAVRAEIRRRYVVPVIRKILSLRERYGLLLWEVETDRGRHRFVTRSGREGVEQLEPHRLILTDIEGNRYYIPDITALDPFSLSLLRRHLL